MNCFNLFTHHIINDHIDEAKLLITPENVNEFRVVSVLCQYLSKDDPDILQYFVDMGANVDEHALSFAAMNGFVNITRRLLDLGHPVNATALEQLNNQKTHSLVAMVLIDAGCCVGARIHKTWEKMRSFRESVRSSAISTMGALQRSKRAGKDVARIIGRSIWALRGIYEEDE